MNEYIIINKTQLLKRIEELEKEVEFYHKVGALSINPNKVKAETELSLLKQILSQSTPLIPEIEEAFHEGTLVPYDKSKPLNKWFVNVDQRLEKYISNLNLDI